jgi:hypothetical protein
MGRNPGYRPSWAELLSAAEGHGRTDRQTHNNFYLVRR